ncbi:MAG: M20/M25/M40 family metallo-hydrolase [Pseudomonadales bacterium]|nr:M20/M25/M40 family metallo-hydrolase [Pseudomonadales bacterium]
MRTKCVVFIATLWILNVAEAAEDRYQVMAKELLRELVAIDTTEPTGDNTVAANLLAARLLAAGLPEADVQVIESAPKKGNLVARLRASNPQKRPILLLAHMDVVTAHPEDWTYPPFEMTEIDGIWYGRGVTDDKDEVAIHAVNLIRWKEEKVNFNRDIIIALTADEEGGPDNGLQYLLAHHRELVDAAFAINEGGGGVMQDGERQVNGVQAAEKVYQSFTLGVKNPGGHSSRPRKDNAIYQLARALIAIEALQFPVEMNEVTRSMLTQMKGSLAPEQAAAIDGVMLSPPDEESVELLSADTSINSLLRTTCVATELDGGHAENALPQTAQATVNCRMMPGRTMTETRLALIEAMADAEVSVTPVKVANLSPASPLTEEVMDPIYRVTQQMWPGVIVVPAMSTGATDGLFLRQVGIPVYGTSGIFTERSGSGAHGQNERIHAQSFYDGLEYLNRLVREFATN